MSIVRTIILSLLLPTALCAAATQPKKQTSSKITIEGKTVSVRCAPAPDNGIEKTIAEKLTTERERIYTELERTTTDLINEEVSRQGIPLSEIANESRGLADMSDSHAEQIYLLADELAEITTKLVRMESGDGRSRGLIGRILMRIIEQKIIARKTRIENKMADLISVRAELEGGIEKNRENTEEIRVMIATAFKTPRMDELEKKLAVNAAQADIAALYCKERAALRKEPKSRR